MNCKRCKIPIPRGPIQFCPSCEKMLRPTQPEPAFKPLEDVDKMTFGMHRNKCMQDVPASWYHWFWTEADGKDNMTSPVADYIRRNLDALKMEYPDGVWE